MTDDAPALLPPERAGSAALPRWVLPVALVGLVVLFASALPALLARRRLERESVELQEQVRATELRIERTRREKTSMESDSFVRDRALEELLAPGRAGGGAPPGPPPRPAR